MLACYKCNCSTLHPTGGWKSVAENWEKVSSSNNVIVAFCGVSHCKCGRFKCDKYSVSHLLNLLCLLFSLFSVHWYQCLSRSCFSYVCLMPHFYEFYCPLLIFPFLWSFVAINFKLWEIYVSFIFGKGF